MSDAPSACLAIQRASSEDEVVCAVRNYLTSLSPSEAALMPPGLVALGQSHAQNLVESALQLVHHEVLAAADAPETELLRQAVLVFAAATARLALLAVRPSPAGPTHPRVEGPSSAPGIAA